MSYAEGTSVPVEKSRVELETMLAKAGAKQAGVMSDYEGGRATVVFRLADRQVRLVVPLPKLEDFAKRKGRYSYMVAATKEQQTKAYEQACRTRWRQMVLLVKAKLEAIAMGLSTVEREFLADIYLADGRTVHQALVGDLERMYRDGTMPPLLGPGSSE